MAYGKIEAPGAPFMSKDEKEYLTEAYRSARVILEYGSGGSTRIAAQMPGKLIFAVESDLKWALELEAQIEADGPASPVIVYPVDIGPVGPWGRPRDATHWRKYQRYPLAIWDEPFFRHPDLILIDGRMRCACLVHAMLRIEKPVTVLFDDYRVRKQYQLIERVIEPRKIIGTMAQFDLEPDSLDKCDLGVAIRQFFLGSTMREGNDVFYEAEDIL